MDERHIMANKKEIKATEVKTAPVPSKTIVVKHDFKKLFWIAIAVAAVWGVAAHPQWVSYAKRAMVAMMNRPASQSVNLSENADDRLLSEQISLLRDEINFLKNNLAAESSLSESDNKKLEAINQRFETMEKTNLSIIDGKADVATVLGIVTRLDALEEKVKVLSKATDESALILTAVMMVKEAGDRGGSFAYEAGVLHELAKDNSKISAAVARIEKYAQNGIATNTQLINEFESIYNALLKKQKEEFEKTWKDRLNSKLNEFIKVRKVNGEAEEAFEADKALLSVKSLVEAGDFAAAVNELEAVDNADIVKDEALEKWIAQAKAKVEFYDAINQISTHSLAVMKVSSIRKEINND